MSHRVCFVALHSYPAIDPSVARPVGGTETRAWEFARELGQRSDWSVTFVVRGGSDPILAERDGVQLLSRPERLYTLYESVGQSVQRAPRFPYLRLNRWDSRLLWQLPALMICRPFERRRDPRLPDPFFRGVETEIFVTFGVQANSARVIASAKATGRPAVLMIASDVDLDDRYVSDSTYVSPYGDRAEVCHWLIQQADAIVVQTESQQRMLQERFDREGTVIGNPIDVAWWAEQGSGTSDVVRGEQDRYVLWVGRAESIHKRPQVLIELAKRCPEVPFLMILNPRDRAVEDQIRRDAPQNVRIVSSVPYDEMPRVMSRAALLVNTSSMEGFPNVFLQAAACQVPVVSLRVGREFLAESGAGLWADDDMGRLQESVTELWTDQSRAGSFGQSGHAFVLQHHDRATQVHRLEELLLSVIDAD